MIRRGRDRLVVTADRRTFAGRGSPSRSPHCVLADVAEDASLEAGRVVATVRDDPFGGRLSAVVARWPRRQVRWRGGEAETRRPVLAGRLVKRCQVSSKLLDR